MAGFKHAQDFAKAFFQVLEVTRTKADGDGADAVVFKWQILGVAQDHVDFVAEFAFGDLFAPYLKHTGRNIQADNLFGIEQAHGFQCKVTGAGGDIQDNLGIVRLEHLDRLAAPPDVNAHTQRMIQEIVAGSDVVKHFRDLFLFGTVGILVRGDDFAHCHLISCFNINVSLARWFLKYRANLLTLTRFFWHKPQKQGQVRENRLIMEITTAYFFRSAQHYSQLPPADKPEFAFVGRSNVGKSSLINKVVNQKGLAKTSSTPGKTQLINHFVINKTWYLVDLPGFGYARVSKKTRAQFQGMIQDYVTKRPNLVTVFVLVDSRHEPQKLDLEFMEYLGEAEVPFAIVFTKSDKLGKPSLEYNLGIYKSKLLEQWEELPPLFVTSAESGMGCAELRAYIGENLELLGDLPVQSV